MIEQTIIDWVMWAFGFFSGAVLFYQLGYRSALKWAQDLIARNYQ